MSHGNILYTNFLDLSSAFVCPSSDIINTGCKGPKDCVYPNPGSPSTYIKCVVNADGKTATPVIRTCPTGLVWNDRNKICDYPLLNDL